jgi:hypothetical protein
VPQNQIHVAYAVDFVDVDVVVDDDDAGNNVTKT